MFGVVLVAVRLLLAAHRYALLEVLRRFIEHREGYMSLLHDIMKTLDRWDEWKKIRANSAKVDGLEQRVAALEEMLSGRYPPEVCRKCGGRTLRLDKVFGPDSKGLMREMWNCQEPACNFHEERSIKPR